MSDARVAYAPRPEATLEAELSALASVYRCILDCHHAKKKAAPTSRPDAAKGFQNDRDRISIPEAN